MKGLFTFVIVVIAIAIFYMWCVHPNAVRKEETLRFTKWKYAHRGLWNPHIGIPENSVPAFKEAVKHGFGIELDVHLTADNKLVVFHDQTLNRMCNFDGSSHVEDLTVKELKKQYLMDTSHQIPLLKDVLALVDGKVPLLIEIKAYSTNATQVCEQLAEQMKSYKGDYVIESFNPFALSWYRKNHPQVIRGQLSCRHESCEDISVNFWGKKALEALLVNMVSRPDFIAYNYNDKLGLGMKLLQRWNTPMFAWTVRDTKMNDIHNMGFHTIIFEQHSSDMKYKGYFTQASS